MHFYGFSDFGFGEDKAVSGRSGVKVTCCGNCQSVKQHLLGIPSLTA